MLEKQKKPFDANLSFAILGCINKHEVYGTFSQEDHLFVHALCFDLSGMGGSNEN